jgi:ketoreductase
LREAVGRAIDLWGCLDIAVANAGSADGVGLGASTDGGDESRFDRVRAVFETNLLGTYYLFDLAASRMTGPGRLLAVSSVLGKFGVAGQAAYCASKAGLHGLVRAAACELGPRRITCNAVCPGWVDTAMARTRIANLALDAGMTADEMAVRARNDLPLRRFVEAEEVAKLVAFLCSRAADAITGQALSICAGATSFAG